MTDDPKLIAEAALDSLSETLAIDCNWIQLTSQDNEGISLVACRNFTPEIYSEMAEMDAKHYCNQEIVGLGNRVIIPDLSMDGSYGMGVFERAGFRSIIAVPITTYKVFGVLGAAYRERKKFGNDFSQLFMVIANLIGMALNRKTMSKQMKAPTNNLQNNQRSDMIIDKKRQTEEEITVVDENAGISGVFHSEDGYEAFKEHVRRIRAFRKSHK